MNYTKYFILLSSLISIITLASDDRYYELKARYKNGTITPAETNELRPMAAARRISKYISDPNADPLLIAMNLNPILAHPLYNDLDTVQVGNRIYRKVGSQENTSSPDSTQRIFPGLKWFHCN